ncbi:MAG: D-alanine--D-alanine ligase [Pseudomonadota bacterium]
MDIGLAYDLKSSFTAAAEAPIDRLEEYDEESTIAALEQALRAHGHSPRRLGGGRAFAEALLARPPQLVFNIAEGRGARSREAQVPALCEMLGVPCTHSDPLALALSLDKALTKRVVAAAGVPTPPFAVVRHLADLRKLKMGFPLLVKPLAEGSSMGVRLSSRVTDAEELREECRRQLDDYDQPVLVEGFCPGVELTVGVLGVRGRAKVIGTMEIAPTQLGLESFVYSLEVKRDWRNQVAYKVPPTVAPAVVEEAEKIALQAYAALDCRDVARVDLRLDDAGRPAFIEINPLPGLNPETSDLCILARGRGMTYDSLIAGIVDSARARYKL